MPTCQRGVARCREMSRSVTRCRADVAQMSRRCREMSRDVARCREDVAKMSRRCREVSRVCREMSPDVTKCALSVDRRHSASQEPRGQVHPRIAGSQRHNTDPAQYSCQCGHQRPVPGPGPAQFIGTVCGAVSYTHLTLPTKA